MVTEYSHPADATGRGAKAADSSSASSAPGATTQPMAASEGMLDIAMSPNEATVVRLASSS